MGFRARVTVLGSLNMDISVAVPRLPGPGATVLGGGASFAPGGKGANQAVAAARLGAAVRMTGCVGDDDFGGRLRMALRDEGVADEGVRTVPGTPTGLAMITVDAAGENMITVAPGANRETGPEEIAAIAAAPADVLVISAEIPAAAIRAALATGESARSQDPRSYRALPLASAHPGGYPPEPPGGPGLRILNLAPAPPEAAELIAAGVDWLVVNESEAAAVLGRDAATDRAWPTEARDTAGEARGAAAGGTRDGISGEGRGAAAGGTRDGISGEARGAAAGETRDGISGEARGAAARETQDGIVWETGAGARRIRSAADAAAELVALGARNAVVTAGAAGAAWHGAGNASVTVPGFKVQAVDSVGAGDTFVGALAVALAAGIEPAEAVRVASAAGAAAATRPGTQSGMPRPADVLASTGLTWPLP